MQLLGRLEVASAVVLPAVRAECREYGNAKVRAICADPARANAVETTLGIRFESDLFRRPAASV